MRFLLRRLGDRRDERRARRTRAILGRRRWLVSWEPTERGIWLARLSCPEVPETIERTGPTRSAAIARAVEGLTLIRQLTTEAHAR